MTDRASAEGLRANWLDTILLRYVNLPFGQAEALEAKAAIEAALRDTGSRPDSGIDVERLAEALHESDLMRRYSEYADAVPTMTPTPEHTLCIEWAAIIAREYARLSTPRIDVGRVRVLGLSIEEIRRAVATADMYYPQWRASTPRTETSDD